MHVGVDVKCMHTNFCGRSVFSFGYMATFQKQPNFPFGAWTIVHGCQKNLIDWNWLKKFMHVGVDVKCKYTNFGGCGISSFGDIATFKTAKFPFLTMDYSPWVSKNLIDRNWLKKFMHVGVDVKCMYTNFGWRSFCSFEDMATFQKRPNFPFGAWTIVRS